MRYSSLPFWSLVLVGAASSARAGDAVDTRVTFTVGDDDIARNPTETVTASPSLPTIGTDGDSQVPGDNHERRDSGFENLSHLILYAAGPSLFSGLETEAALVLRAQLLDEKETRITEDGSYINLKFGPEGSQWLVTAFPVSADRFRLGYSYELSWGGSRIFKPKRGGRAQSAPGLRVQYRGETLYGFFGVKTATVPLNMTDGTIELDTVWGLLAGGGLDVLPQLRLEAGTGFFARGTIDKPQLRRTRDGTTRVAPWQGYGASAQIIYHVGLPIGTPIDFRLYKNDPLQREVFFQQDVYDEATSWEIRAEASLLGQTLQDIERLSSTTNQWASAGDVSASVKRGKWRAHALVVYRTLEFILYNVPSFTAFVDIPDGLQAEPEILARLGADYHVESWRMTPGIVVGAVRPASLTATVPAGANAPAHLGFQTTVYRSEVQRDILLPGEEVGLHYFAKATARMTISELLQVVCELQYNHDPNRRKLLQADGINTYARDAPDSVGFLAMLRARF